MTKHAHILSICKQHIGEKVVICDHSTLQVLGYDDVIINSTTKSGDVLHVASVGPNLLSIYHITHINKRV
jgi:hypothetical protein